MNTVKKALIITSVASMVDQFLMPSITLLQEMGYKVEVACNFRNGSTCDTETITLLQEKLCAIDVDCHHIDFSRKILNIRDNFIAYKQVKKLLDEKRYNLMHCHSPIGGLISRIAAIILRKKGLKVIYTAHGFHFYKGAPKLNWMLYYPIEKACSRVTDKLVTINHEDYALAKKKLKAKEVVYIPGVGIDLDRLENIQVDRNAKRTEIGIKESDFLLFSVGELNANKNHQVIIRALAMLNNPTIHYAIAGVGEKKEYLLNLANELGISEQVHLLGYRKDVLELNYSADIFCFPSRREGLGMAAIEAMACGLPLLTSNVHGINDYSESGKSGLKCNPDDVDGMAECISQMYVSDKRKEFGKYNRCIVKKYSTIKVLETMRGIYEE